MAEQQASPDSRELDWPGHFDRTPADEREPYPGEFTVTRKEAFESIEDEFERWGAYDITVETASQHYADRPNIPHQHDRPDDTGVVVRCRHEDEPADTEIELPCDCWETQLENARALALFVRRQRLAERCGVKTARSTSSLGRLPAGNPEAAMNATAMPAAAVKEEPDPLDGRDPLEVLGFGEDADPTTEVIETVARKLKAKYHPDGSDPDADEWDAVKAAEEVLIDE